MRFFGLRLWWSVWGQDLLNIAGVATVIVGLVSLLMFGIKVGLAVIKLAERACS